MHPPTADAHTSPPFKTDHSDRRAGLPILSPVDPILEAALAYHEQGFCVLPVMKDKKPYVKWEEHQDRWRREGQTHEDVKYLFDCPEVPRYGIALLTYPYSPFVTIDFDGPHAAAAWEKKGIELPETATNYSQSGFPHFFFSPPEATNGLKRSIRLAKEERPCGWKDEKACGVDLLINGYVIVPPTPGYTENPDLPPFGTFSPLPSEVLRLLDTERSPGASVTPREARDWVGLLDGPVPEGERHDKAVQLVGHLLGNSLVPEKCFCPR